MAEPELDLQITISSEDFEKQKTDSDFVSIVALARVTNAVNFCLTVLSSANKEMPTPAESRQALNAFLYASGVLYEGLKVAQTLGKDFSSLESFKNGFAPLFKDKTTEELRQGPLNKARNQVAFHFWKDDVIGSTLKAKVILSD